MISLGVAAAPVFRRGCSCLPPRALLRASRVSGHRLPAYRGRTLVYWARVHPTHFNDLKIFAQPFRRCIVSSRDNRTTEKKTFTRLAGASAVQARCPRREQQQGGPSNEERLPAGQSPVELPHRRKDIRGI